MYNMLAKIAILGVVGASTLGLIAFLESGQTGTKEKIVGLPCEGCDIVFVGRPSETPAVARIAPKGEPGEAMRLTGTVKDQKGAPVEGVIVYAYHTDNKGLYPRGGTGHGRLRGWARSNRQGRYTFETIRPNGYPNGTAPQHVHMHVIEPGRCTYYISDVYFGDDPRLTDKERNERSPRCGSGVVTPFKRDGVWIAERNIVLGLNVPGWTPR